MRSAGVDARVKAFHNVVPHVVMLCRMMHRREAKFQFLSLRYIKKVALKFCNGHFDAGL